MKRKQLCHTCMHFYWIISLLNFPENPSPIYTQSVCFVLTGGFLLEISANILCALNYFFALLSPFGCILE
jgi:hypothetical protein